MIHKKRLWKRHCFVPWNIYCISGTLLPPLSISRRVWITWPLIQNRTKQTYLEVTEILRKILDQIFDKFKVSFSELWTERRWLNLPPALSGTASHLAGECQWSWWAQLCGGFNEVMGCDGTTLFSPDHGLSFAQCNVPSPLTLQIITAALILLGTDSGLGCTDGERDMETGQWGAHQGDGWPSKEEDKRSIAWRWRRTK